MQAILSIIMLVFMISLGVLYFVMGKHYRTDYIKKLRNTIISIEWILISVIAIISSTERKTAYLAFTSYYIAIAWFVFLIFRFSISYAGYGRWVYYKTPVFWITIVETIELARAYFDEKLFTITHIRWGNHVMWSSRSFSAFNVFIGACAAFLIVALACLLIATIKSAKIYRLKYFSIFVVLVISIVFYCLAEMRDTPVFAPALCFALSEIVVIYMAIYYAPKKLKQHALMFAAEQLNDGLILYDENHRLQFVTNGFCNTLGIDDESVLKDENAYWTEFIDSSTSDNVWNGKVKEVLRDNIPHFYEIQNKEFDDDGIKVGTVYWIQDVTEAVENYDKMLHRANYDELTGLYNEVHFHEKSRMLLNDNPDKDFIMICSNVEKYRVFSDLFGKERAQQYLLETAKCLKEGLEKYTYCRYGRINEDSFFVIMDKDSYDEKEMLNAIDSVTEKFNTNNYKLTVNLGVYEIIDRSLRMTAICNRAFMACEAAKGHYHRRVVWYDENVQNKSMEEERYNAELTSAIETGQIKIFLQPQTDNDGKVIGAEALARWIHPEEGLIPPIKFIPLFEKNGRISELDICIWRQACERLKKWKEEGREDLHISVNISAKDLYAYNIYELYMDLAKEYGINSKNLKLEITESSVINDIKQHVDLVSQLQKHGFEVEMDDFGSAYSSFNMLKDVCVDVLKLDMKFLGETENVERSRTILRSIITLSKALGMKTVAEGVETKEQFEFLKSAGCDIYQGYYFAKPMSVEEFDDKYLNI